MKHFIYEGSMSGFWMFCKSGEDKVLPMEIKNLIDDRYLKLTDEDVLYVRNISSMIKDKVNLVKKNERK